MKYFFAAAALLVGCSYQKPVDGFVQCTRFGRTASCIAVPLADGVADKQAKQFTAPDSNMSRIYIIRPYTQAPKQRSIVKLNEEVIAEIGPQTFLMFDVPAGSYKLEISTIERAEILLQAQAGETYFLQYRISHFINKVTEDVKTISPVDGQTAVRSGKRARVLTNVAGV